MNYKHLSIALFIVAALLLPGVIKGAWTGYEAYQAQKQANDDIICGFSTPWLGHSAECRKAYLKANNDLSCDDGLCCGGNSVGWYECF